MECAALLRVLVAFDCEEKTSQFVPILTSEGPNSMLFKVFADTLTQPLTHHTCTGTDAQTNPGLAQRYTAVCK